MYDTQFVADRIKLQIKNGGYTIKTMLSDLGLGVNTISHLAKGQEISYLNLAKIADYLECSVDYLLGRVDTPNGIYSINGDNNVQVNGNNSPTNVTSSKNIKQDNMIEEFMQSFEKLDFADKVSVMSFTMSKINK